MVRLKAWEVCTHVFILSFQFLYGAIKRDSVYVPAADEADFNSYMVRLKVKKYLKKKLEKYYFNSYMVRLKAMVELANAGVARFQFLYGAIKRVWN